MYSNNPYETPKKRFPTWAKVVIGVVIALFLFGGCGIVACTALVIASDNPSVSSTTDSSGSSTGTTSTRDEAAYTENVRQDVPEASATDASGNPAISDAKLVQFGDTWCQAKSTGMSKDEFVTTLNSQVPAEQRELGIRLANSIVDNADQYLCG